MTDAALLDSIGGQTDEESPLPQRWQGGQGGYRLPLLAALGLVVLAHGPYLIGAFDPNPALTLSGLARPGAHMLIHGATSADPNAGFTSQANGHRAALNWIHGHIPWWNPWEAAGQPLAGALGSAAFFLPFVLFTLLPNGQVLLYLVLGLIAAGATFALLRHLRAHRWACFAGAVLFGLNGTNAWFRYVADNPVAFLPVILLGIEQTRLAAVESRHRGWALIAVGTGFSLLAGFPETAYCDGLVALVWLVVRSGGLGLAVRWVIVRRAVIGVGVGLLLAAPLIVAFVDFLPHGDVGSHAHGIFGSLSLPSPGMVTLFAPYGLGPVQGFTGPGAVGATIVGVWGGVGGYLTAAIVLLAAFGLLVGRTHRALRLSLGGTAVILTARNFGFPPARGLINLLPTASNDAVFRYDLPAIEMAVVVLVALALDDLFRHRISRPAIGVTASIVVVLGLLAADQARTLQSKLVGPDTSLWWELSLLWAGVSIAVVTVTLLLAGRRLRSVVIVSVLVVEALTMFVVPDLSAPRQTHLDTAGVAFLRRHVGTSRFFSFNVFAPDYGAYYGVASADVNDLPVAKSWQRYVMTRLGPNVEPIIVNGANTIAPSGPSPSQQLAFDLAGYRHLAVDYLVFPDGAALPALPPGTVTEVYHDRVMDVYRLAGAEDLATAADPGCRVMILGADAMTTACSGRASLLRRETMMPGWTARVNGRTVTPSMSPDGFQTVVVPAGRATVRFSFRPPYESEAWMACLAGALLATGGWVRPAWQRLSRRSRRAWSAIMGVICRGRDVAPQTGGTLRS